MQVLAKIDLTSALDTINHHFGKIYGPIVRNGGNLLFGPRTDQDLELEKGLPVNSMKDIILSKLSEYAVTRENYKAIVLFGVRPCDMKAVESIDRKITSKLGENFIKNRLSSLLVANACDFAEKDCFCETAGGNPKISQMADILLNDVGDKIFFQSQSDRGTRAISLLSEILRPATNTEEDQLKKLKSQKVEFHRTPEIKKAIASLQDKEINDQTLNTALSDCLQCGACARICPMHTPKLDAQGEGVSKTISEIATSEQPLPYLKKLQSASLTSVSVECTGCGRCTTVCPSGTGILKVLDRLSGISSKKQSKTINPDKNAPRWVAQIRDKIVTPKLAFSKIKAGESIFIASGCAEPQFLASEFMNNYAQFMNVQVIHLLSMGAISFEDPKFIDHIRLNAFFVGDKSRKAVAQGLADYTPVFLTDLPKLFRKGQIEINVALIQVSPPNRHGYCSLGISVETIKAAVEHARYVVAQINPNMPHTHGDSAVHIDQLDAVILHDEPLIEWQSPPIGARNRKIGQYVSMLIEDRATIQIGIGKIGQALLPFLAEKKDLGVHTQIITNEVINLIRKGVVTNKFKEINRGKTIASFAVGTKKMYDILDHNPAVEFYGMDYVSDPSIIEKNHKMTSINSAFEVDLTGQVCADSINNQFYSGIASMANFLRGAAGAENGKPIIALPATAKGGTYSRIRPQLSAGHPVVATRGDVHYVVTEYGIAYLHGKSIRERALALVEIAHPDFRSWLLEEAKQLNYVFEDQELPSLTQHLYPEQWETTITLDDGEEFFVRPIKATDETALQRLYYSLSDQDVFFRFMGNDKHFKHGRMQAMTVVDYKDRMALVAIKGSLEKEEIMGIARYDIDPASLIAEVAFTVRDNMRKKGIGTKMLEHLTVIAKSQGALGLRAEVLQRNRAMLNLFKTSGAEVHSHVEDGMYTLWYNFDEDEPSPIKPEIH